MDAPSVMMPPLAAPRRVGTLLAAAAVTAALAAAFGPTLWDLSEVWEDPNYSHGYFVVPIALAILWQRRGRLAGLAPRPRWYGWAALAVVLGLRSYFYQINSIWFEAATIPPALAALALGLGGWPLLGWAAPAIAFLYFMLPLPGRVNLLLAHPLQRLATIGSGWVLQLIGVPVLAEGNVLIVGGHPLEVARACNGLSMLLSFVTLITAAAILIARPLWERLVLLASAIPIALISNILRITITALCYYWISREAGEGFAHDWAGYAMMPMALVMVGVELKVLSWLLIEEDEVEGPATADPAAIFARVQPTTYRVVKKVAPGGAGPEEA